MIKHFRGAVILGLPAVIFMLALFVLPTGLMVVSSFGVGEETGFTLVHFGKALQGPALRAILMSFWISLGILAVVTLIGVPYGWLMAHSSPRRLGILIGLLFLPILTSEIVLGYGWVIVFGTNGVVNNVLQATGLIDAPIQLLYTPIAVVFGLSGLLMPFIVIPVATALAGINPELYLAGASLGASRLRQLVHITVPLVKGAWLSGATVVYALAMSAYAVPAVLGGQQVQTAPLLIYSYYTELFNLPLGGAVALALLVAVLAPVVIFVRNRNIITGK